MAPPRKHETDVILDAARALVLEGGPRAASVAAIAKSSGAPAGTLYHRFGSRDGILTAAWLRALERFQSRAMAASETSTADAPAETAVAMAVVAISFARELPEDARLLLTIRPADLLDDDPDAQFQATVAAMNAPLTERVGVLARELYGAQRFPIRRRRCARGRRPALCRRPAARARRADAVLAGGRCRGVGARGASELWQARVVVAIRRNSMAW